jgi:hypothetical protein
MGYRRFLQYAGTSGSMIRLLFLRGSAAFIPNPQRLLPGRKLLCCCPLPGRVLMFRGFPFRGVQARSFYFSEAFSCSAHRIPRSPPPGGNRQAGKVP